MKGSIKTVLVAAVAVIILVIGVAVFGLASCKAVETPAVTFSFKDVDSAADYNESLTSFEVGKKFYTCIAIKLVTDKKKAQDYKVVVTVPKTSQVEVKEMGGLDPDSIEWDEQKQETVLTYTIKGYKEAILQKLLFYGVPTGEGEAKMTLKIYNKKGETVEGWSRTVFFVYDLQQ